jgi:hypothetical protein
MCIFIITLHRVNWQDIHLHANIAQAFCAAIFINVHVPYYFVSICSSYQFLNFQSDFLLKHDRNCLNVPPIHKPFAYKTNLEYIFNCEFSKKKDVRLIWRRLLWKNFCCVKGHKNQEIMWLRFHYVNQVFRITVEDCILCHNNMNHC